MQTSCCFSWLSTPGFEVPATELMSPQEILHVRVPEPMGSDKLAQQAPEAAATTAEVVAAAAGVEAEPEVESDVHFSAREKSHTSLRRLPEELGLLAVRLNGTFLSPLELLVVACASRGWCQAVEECSAGLGFADGPFTQALQIESQLMCELLVFDVDFDPRDFRLALLVGAESVDQVPKRVAAAVTQVRYLPNVRMPSDCPAEAIEWTTIPCDASKTRGCNCPTSCRPECHALSSEKPGARLGGNTKAASSGTDQQASFSSMRPVVDLLRRAWANAYIDADGNCDLAIRKQAFDLLKHWRALWCCGLRTRTISAGCLHVMLPGQSLTGVKETWDLSAVVLTFPSGVVAAAHVSYVGKEQKFHQSTGNGNNQ